MKTYNLLIVIVALFLTSCENDPGIEASKETFLPKIVLKGSSNVTLPCGTTSYSDPGVDASENGVAVTPDIKVSARYFGSPEINSPDIYDISYGATNIDGIPGAVTRTVLIPPCTGDLVNSIEGLYTSTIVRTSYAGAVLTGAIYTDMKYVLIRHMGNNVYQISDVLCGWYEYGRGLGITYAGVGATFTANNIAANDFTYGPAVEVGGFGGAATITSITVDAGKKQVNVKTDWAQGFKFDAVLTQVQ